MKKIFTFLFFIVAISLMILPACHKGGNIVNIVQDTLNVTDTATHEITDTLPFKSQVTIYNYRDSLFISDTTYEDTVTLTVLDSTVLKDTVFLDGPKVDKIKWEIKSTSNDTHVDRGFDNLFDGDWGYNSIVNTEWTPSRLPYPHYVTVDMTEILSLKGFYLIDRDNDENKNQNQAPTKFTLYVGNDYDATKDTILTEGIEYEVGTNKKKIPIPVMLPENTPPFRYFKFVFTEGQDANVMDLSEIGAMY